jgi:aryl-alcohol dehydrogenase-like predicted oxidoreductase
MTFKKLALSILAMTVMATPALAQGRYGDQAKENAARREERAAIRKMEEEYEKEVAAAKAAQAQAKAEQSTTVAAAPAAPAEPAATPAPAPAPAQ